MESSSVLQPKGSMFAEPPFTLVIETNLYQKIKVITIPGVLLQQKIQAHDLLPGPSLRNCNSEHEILQ